VKLVKPDAIFDHAFNRFGYAGDALLLDDYVAASMRRGLPVNALTHDAAQAERALLEFGID
jgi:hypothetical protein